MRSPASVWIRRYAAKRIAASVPSHKIGLGTASPTINDIRVSKGTRKTRPISESQMLAGGCSGSNGDRELIHVEIRPSTPRNCLGRRMRSPPASVMNAETTAVNATRSCSYAIQPTRTANATPTNVSKTPDLSLALTTCGGPKKRSRSVAASLSQGSKEARICPSLFRVRSRIASSISVPRSRHTSGRFSRQRASNSSICCGETCERERAASANR